MLDRVVLLHRTAPSHSPQRRAVLLVPPRSRRPAAPRRRRVFPPRPAPSRPAAGAPTGCGCRRRSHAVRPSRAQRLIKAPQMATPPRAPPSTLICTAGDPRRSCADDADPTLELRPSPSKTPLG
ncbi:hypothetical protein ACP70R_039578 [Stipagrostis hirtigluma subsp. patula]